MRGGGHDLAMAEFVRCIIENEEPTPNGEDGLRVLRIIEALYQSAESGQEVRI